jgi:DNA mismatch repair protein MutS
LRNLEILEPLHAGRAAPRPRLYGALNRTVTPMGARRLRDWLSQPLAAAAPIRAGATRCSSGSERAALDEFRRELAEVRDLERTIGPPERRFGNGRDLVALRQALEKFPAQKFSREGCGPARRCGIAGHPEEKEEPRRVCLDELAGQLAEAPDLVELIGAPSWTSRRWRSRRAG